MTDDLFGELEQDLDLPDEDPAADLEAGDNDGENAPVDYDAMSAEEFDDAIRRAKHGDAIVDDENDLADPADREASKFQLSERDREFQADQEAWLAEQKAIRARTGLESAETEAEIAPNVMADLPDDVFERMATAVLSNDHSTLASLRRQFPALRDLIEAE